jgi:hypothetical protein
MQQLIAINCVVCRKLNIAFTLCFAVTLIGVPLGDDNVNLVIRHKLRAASK